MGSLSYDLHIHSCLSPCGDDDMTPGNIVGMAALKGLDVIAVTDHNTCLNCPAVMKLAGEYGILAIPGMELTTLEEVHVLCLFYDLPSALAFSSYVYERLPEIANEETIFGKQQICDESDAVTGIVPKLLINAAGIGFDEVYGLLREYNGIMIPAHIDKNANSLLANLGFIPPDSLFSCVEIKDLKKLHGIQKEHPYTKGCRILTNSDAHYLEHIHEPDHAVLVEEKSIKGVLDACMKPVYTENGHKVHL